MDLKKKISVQYKKLITYITLMHKHCKVDLNLWYEHLNIADKMRAVYSTYLLCYSKNCRADFQYGLSLMH